jgi:hypothetical protein
MLEEKNVIILGVTFYKLLRHPRGDVQIFARHP